MKSAITVCLFPEAKSGPFVYSNGIADGFERAAALGFDAVELFPPSAVELDLAQISRLMEKHRLNIAAIGSGAGWVKHKLRLTDSDPAVRRRARAFISDLLAVAAKLHTSVILGSMQGSSGGEVSRAQALAWLAEALEELGAQAETSEVTLLYEFLNRYETNLCNRVTDSLEFLESLRTRNIKLLCDLFHMNIEEADIAAAVRRAGARLGHIHFADSNRLAVGSGHINMIPILAALREINYSGYLSGEIFPLPDSDAAARQTVASFRKLVASVPDHDQPKA